jgi:hypothetical protein
VLDLDLSLSSPLELSGPASGDPTISHQRRSSVPEPVTAGRRRSRWPVVTGLAGAALAVALVGGLAVAGARPGGPGSSSALTGASGTGDPSPPGTEAADVTTILPPTSEAPAGPTAGPAGTTPQGPSTAGGDTASSGSTGTAPAGAPGSTDSSGATTPANGTGAAGTGSAGRSGTGSGSGSSSGWVTGSEDAASGGSNPVATAPPSTAPAPAPTAPPPSASPSSPAATAGVPQLRSASATSFSITAGQTYDLPFSLDYTSPSGYACFRADNSAANVANVDIEAGGCNRDLTLRLRGYNRGTFTINFWVVDDADGSLRSNSLTMTITVR